MVGTRAPYFSICIPAYEDAAAVRRAVESLLGQDMPDWECVIGDDSPTGAVAAVVRSMADPRLRYSRTRPPLGAPRNWNRVLSLATGRVVSLLHQDDFYDAPHVLSAVRTAFDDGRTRVAVCGRSLWHERTRVAVYHRSDRAVRHFLQDFPQRSLVVNRIGHPSVVFLERRLCVPFDAGLCYFLDTDWYARLWRQADGAVTYLPQAVVGLEMGRSGQLSGQCVRDLGATADELCRVLAKWRATPWQEALAHARFFAAHLRQFRHGWLAALGRTAQGFSLWQKGVLGGAIAVLTWHMLYRALRRSLGLAPWG